jgi:hypothetical protein
MIARSISATRSTLPPWARYVVEFGVATTHPLWSTPNHVCQAFRARKDAERFARRAMQALPARSCDSSGAPLVWALVYALRVDGRDRGHCYMSFDNGGAIAKRHTIHVGYHGGPLEQPSTSRWG